MATEEILTAEQRRDVIAFAGATDAEQLDDEALLGLAAEKIGMEGELAVDAGGMVELARGDVLVILEAVESEDAQYVEYPEQLHLAVYLRPDSDEERQRLEDADLLEPVAEQDAIEAEGWTYAWWGAMCTNLARDADLPTQMQALERALREAEAAVEARSPDRFLEQTRWLEYEPED